MAKVLDWAKANYDRAVLIGAGVFLFICAIAIWWSAIEFGNRLLSQQSPPAKAASPPAVAVELDQDADNDGFTNLEEWQASTDPTDKNSHPDYTTKLHLVSATEEPFAYIFASRIGDTFGINAIDLSEPTQFLKVGDVIRGTDFKIVKII